MSGGKGKVDPYYQKDPPNRSNIDDTNGEPESYRNAVKPIRVQRGKDGRKEYVYRCEHCGKTFATGKRKSHERAFHNKECQYEWQKYGKPPPVFSDEAHAKMSEAQRRLWKDPVRRQTRIQRIREVARSPEYRSRQSAIAKEIASRPEWKRKQSEYRKGRKLPPEVGKKISKAKMGHPVSPETRRKLSEAAKGSKSYFWRGGIAGQRQKFYRSWEWRSQRKRVMERDKYRCRKCGRSKDEVKRMSVHHTIPLDDWPKDPRDYPDELCITVCNECHGKMEYKDGNDKRSVERKRRTKSGHSDNSA